MKRFLIWVSFLTLPLLLCGCGRQEPQRLQDVDTAMGTVIQQNLYVLGEAKECPEEILKRIRDLEERTLSWRLESSEVYGINRSGGRQEGFEVSEELGQALQTCLKLTEDSGGAFDVALGPVARLWDIDGWASGQRTGGFRPPDVRVLTQALECSGSGRLRLETSADLGRDGGKARLYMEEGTMLDLGAVGKGLALDRILEYLQTNDAVLGSTVSVGGSVLTYGEKPDGTAWRVAITDPRDVSGSLGMLVLEGQWCVSTSGDYERYVESGGVRYHHILDPSTGYPADSGLCSVTVVTKEGLLSDALSTACFVLGREKGMELAGQYGVEALFVESSGEIFMTPDMEKLFRGKSDR